MQAAANGVRPLDGLKVIDVASFLAGPFCSTQLAEFGADVIKLELPNVGDALRRFGSITPSGDSLPWLSECRNKKSATLDLRKPEGAELLKALVKESDVLVENFQPGTLEGWGLGWDVLREVNPKLIMVRITGYGQTGPYKGRPASVASATPSAGSRISRAIPTARRSRPARRPFPTISRASTARSACCWPSRPSPRPAVAR